MPTDPRAMAEEAARRLQGTCESIASLGEAFEDLDSDPGPAGRAFNDRLDELVFECTQCNWWWEMSEMAEDCGDDWICTECAGENDGN